ncbi:MAG: alpha-isopropylmalate synthase regulatory domain-containing protein [Lachnospiraceae bacterium]|nr:alpha-isopropylmalate synthase regulatory domain-containing protein [Lachnospiraceae bacterium]
MSRIKIADITIKESAERNGFSLNFKERVEVAKQLEKLNIDVIEMPRAIQTADALLIKSLSPIIKNSVISVMADLNKDEVTKAWNAVSGAKNARIHICIPTSPVQMEFVSGQKPKRVLENIAEVVSYAKTLCNEIEVSAVDATRSEMEFLSQVISIAIENGATIIDLCDTAGNMLPGEFSDFIRKVKEQVPAMEKVELSVTCANTMNMANANTFNGIIEGASQVKTCLIGEGAPSLESTIHMIQERGDAMNYSIGVQKTEFQRIIRKLQWLNGNVKTLKSPFEVSTDVEREEIELDESADISKVIKVVKKLGYELNDDDNAKVYKEFKRVSEKKKVRTKEMEAIIATAALQVPPTYQLVNFVINSGNIITPTAHVTLEKNGNNLKGLSSGDGPIAAAFLAVEMVVGHHYELDDFQIQSVTEGSEAVGNALVKLRSNGKLYSGSGISTDIIGASIRAYVSAINKIAYEEKQSRK